MIKDLVQIADELDSRGLVKEADALDAIITASRSRGSDRAPLGWMRHPGGQRHRRDPEVRQQAKPPDTYEDKPQGRESWAPNRATARMLEQGLKDDEIINKLTSPDGKWKLSHRSASKLLQWETEKRRYLDSLSEPE